MARMEGLTLARGNRGLLLIALSAGLIAAVLVFVAVAQRDGGGADQTSGGVQTVPTVVAAQAIPAGTKITADMVKVAGIPENVTVKGAFGDAGLVVDEVTIVPLAEGEALTPAKIGPLREGDGKEGLNGVLPAGMRGIAVRIEEVTGVGGNLLPGDFVDVIAVYETETGVVATTIMQDLEVLSVAQEAQTPHRTANRDSDGDGTNDVVTVTSGDIPEDVQTRPSAVTVTLAATPEQALMLAYAQEEAIKVYTSLRALGDQGPVPLDPVGAIEPR